MTSRWITILFLWNLKKMPGQISYPFICTQNIIRTKMSWFMVCLLKGLNLYSAQISRLLYLSWFYRDLESKERKSFMFLSQSKNIFHNNIKVSFARGLLKNHHSSWKTQIMNYALKKVCRFIWKWHSVVFFWIFSRQFLWAE